ncbi:MAG TPA: acyltransferase family protein, partial [Polyangiales bacterium]
TYQGFVEAILMRGFVGFFVGVALTALFPLDAPRHPDAPRERALAYAWDAVAVINGAVLHRYMAFESVASRPGVDFVVGMLVIPAIIVGAVRGRLIPRLLAVAPLQLLGRISYSLYLVHFPIQAVFLLLYPPPDRWLNYARPEIMAAYVAATLAVSYLTWRFVEVPAQSLLQRVTLRARSQPAHS